MRIPCPYCGERDHSEFTYRGDAAPKRPALRVQVKNEPLRHRPDVDVFDYVHMRENTPGLMRELWHHAGGCRAWLVVERNTSTHSIGRVEAARAIPGRESSR